MVLELSKKVLFLQLCAEFCKKSKSIKAIYIYASGRFRYALSESGNVYCAMAYCFWIVRVWNPRILLSFCWFSIFFYFSITNISRMVVQTPLNHIIFWMCVMRTFRFIYVNYFNKPRFFAEISTKLLKMYFFGQSNDHNSGNKHGNCTNDYLFVTFIFVFKNSQNSFSCGLTFGPFWSVKYSISGKLPTRTVHHTFLKSRHSKVIKNPCYVLSPDGKQKKRYHLMDYKYNQNLSSY